MSDLQREVDEALMLASGPATVRELAEAFLDTQCRRAEAERQVRRLSVDCNALRIALRSGLPNCLGCGKEFHTFVDAYRCTHCDSYLHKTCAEQHFGDFGAGAPREGIVAKTLDGGDVEEVRKCETAGCIFPAFGVRTLCKRCQDQLDWMRDFLVRARAADFGAGAAPEETKL